MSSMQLCLHPLVLSAQYFGSDICFDCPLIHMIIVLYGYHQIRHQKTEKNPQNVETSDNLKRVNFQCAYFPGRCDLLLLSSNIRVSIMHLQLLSQL